MNELVAGTRASLLARVQCDTVICALRGASPGLVVRQKLIRTQGDLLSNTSLITAGGKGLFTGEIEKALLAKKIDFAVHSLKDLPTDLPAGLTVGAVVERETPDDCFISYDGTPPDELPRGSTVGTGSLRRKAQLFICFPGLKPVDIRGNVDTRLKKLDRRECDAIILALAGLRRLGLEQKRPCFPLMAGWYYAVGQGALAVECRANDGRLLDILKKVNHLPSRLAADGERSFLRGLGAGCQVPAGVRTVFYDKTMTIHGMMCGIQGLPRLEDAVSGPFEQAASLGAELAQKLLNRGGEELLRTIHDGDTP